MRKQAKPTTLTELTMLTVQWKVQGGNEARSLWPRLALEARLSESESFKFPGPLPLTEAFKLTPAVPCQCQ